MRIGVIGAGVMGRGIAQVSAMAGHEVVLFDINSEVLTAAELAVQKNLNKAIELGKLDIAGKEVTIANLTYSNAISDVKVDMVIEAIVERLDVKTKVLADLADINGPDTIYASNTSSIPLTQIAAAFVYPQRVVGIHYFNPAHIMKLVEVISAEQTDPDVVEQAKAYVASVNKTCIVAKDAPGFIVNRVARHFYVEGLKVLEEDVASHDVIDDLVRASGFKMGPFQLMDLIGVETNLSVTESMYELFNYDQKFRPNRIQQKKVQAGYYGRKSGKGFYTYNK
ncbi:3-hydroxyacyl-CoA dehydrogenase NAD-binding domain-containing protein [Bacteroidia bacterium]|jgi:3-hydroxybutyryl-CoA dehydrogenase|nr:3-hydroxybutyryl-CoA dehydrogenase [Bacteroidota bacterium]MDA8930123.1 3-hydroxyacyl-CoA dehydrogenase NAD-binding domain-containing protein [Bacteroidia bacterium]MDA9110965.1 3-hydroxyacyl-CoA dehydrogenase NAD-binding domain-containing protein [Bacteroidia bacterium]